MQLVETKQEAYQGPVASLGRESPEVAKLYKVIESYKTEVRLIVKRFKCV